VPVMHDSLTLRPPCPGTHREHDPAVIKPYGGLQSGDKGLPYDVGIVKYGTPQSTRTGPSKVPSMSQPWPTTHVHAETSYHDRQWMKTESII
jgi:hypothetical protein